MKTNKKGQLQMGETIGVLFVFFILLIFGLIFFFNLQKSSMISRQQLAQQLHAVTVAQRISTMPELRCSEEEAQEMNCFDLHNLEIAQQLFPQMVENNLRVDAYFHDSFGEVKVVVRQLNPYTGQWVKNYTLYDKTPTHYKDLNSLPLLIPIVLKNISFENSRGEYYFGQLEVTIFSGAK